MTLRGCRTCLAEMERIALADGSAMLFCAACDLIGEECHLAAGGRCGPAGMARKPLKLAVDRPKPAVVKRISCPGKKSLTA